MLSTPRPSPPIKKYMATLSAVVHLDSGSLSVSLEKAALSRAPPLLASSRSPGPPISSVEKAVSGRYEIVD